MTRLYKKITLLNTLIILTIILTSCGGGREVNTLGIVVATGFDIVDGKIIVTNEVINPGSTGTSSESSTQDATLFVQGGGDTISDAIVNTTLTFDRQLYFPHSHLVIFGEEFAKQGIGDSLDILTRNNEIREQLFMLVAKGSKAFEIMGINSGLAQSPGLYINDIIEQDIFFGKTRTLTINELFRYYYRPHEHFVMGTISSMEKLQLNRSIPETTIEVLTVEGGAAFKDDKLIGYYSGEEMLGFNFLVNELKLANIEFLSPDYLVDKDRVISRTGKFSTVEVFRNNTKKDISFIDGQLHLTVDVQFRGRLIEITQGLDISQPNVLSAMNEACAEKAKSHIEMTLIKAMKEYNVDTFGIGDLVHRKYPELWKEIREDWSEIFGDLKYTINVTAYINNTGFTSTPPNIRRGM